MNMNLTQKKNKLINCAKKGLWLEFPNSYDVDGKALFTAPTIAEINDDITIDADFIREVLLGLATTEPIVGVFIKGAVIKGKLDLKDASSKGFSLPPLRLDDCLILGDEEKRKEDPYDPVIDARHSSLQRLTLKRSRIGIIDLRGAKIERNLDMDSVKPIDETSNACLIAENATINGNINLRACELRLTIPDDDMDTKLEYTDALCFYEAKVAGSLMVYEEKIVDPITKKVIDYNCPKIFGRVSLSYAEFSKNVWFYSTTIKGDIRNRIEKDQSKKAIVAIGLKCQVFRIGQHTQIKGIHNFPATGDIDINYANLRYFHLEGLILEGGLSLFSINVETDVRLKNTNFIENNNVRSHINLVNAEINSDLNLDKINCKIIFANNAIITGCVSVSEFPPRDQVKTEWVDSKKGYISYSAEYEKRLIDFDNACIGSDFSISECFVGLIKAKNIRVKGDTKFKDTFAQFNIKLANIEGELHFDNEDLTILSHIVMGKKNPVRKIIESGIPKITANDLEVAGLVKLNCLNVNAEYDGENVMAEVDFSGGVFKSEFHISDISFRRTFKDSRPVFSLDDAVIEGDIHFEKNKQVRKQLDDFTSFFIDKKRNKSIEEELCSSYEENLRKVNLDEDERDTIENKVKKEIKRKLQEKRKDTENSIQKFFKTTYAEGWDISKFNHRYIKRYKLSCYPKHEYVELISESDSVDREQKLTTSFLLHETDKTQSIHLDGQTTLIDWLNNIPEKEYLKLDDEDQALDYLSFYCAHYHKDDGPFWVVTKSIELNEYLYPPKLHLNINKLNIFRGLTPWPLNVTRVPAKRTELLEYWKIDKVPICYSNFIFLADVTINRNGEIYMAEDYPVAPFDGFNSLVYRFNGYATYDKSEPSKPFSIANYFGWRKISFLTSLEHTRYVLLHLLHVNFRLNGLTSAAFKFDMQGTKHNFGCGINLRLDGFEYKRVEDNDDMFKGGMVSATSNSSSSSDSLSSKFTNNTQSIKPNKNNTDHLDRDKYEGIECVLDTQYDNPRKPTHTGFDSQPYEQMAKVLSNAGAYGAAKHIILKRFKHEALSRNWLIRTKHRVNNTKINKPHVGFISTVALIAVWVLNIKFLDDIPATFNFAKEAFDPIYFWIAIGAIPFVLLVIYIPRLINPYLTDILGGIKKAYALIYRELMSNASIKATFVNSIPVPPKPLPPKQNNEYRSEED